MRLPYLTSLLLVVSILPVIIAEPDVFGDYFDDGMKLVDISQDAALRSCLSNGNTADKTKAAYDECYGQGYDFDDLAKAGGDEDGLPEELEEKESCFYKKMGWVSEDNVMDEAAIAADMEGLENQIQDGFLSDVGTCVAWSGNFGERRKREAGMEVQGESQDTQDMEVVPGLMDTGRRALGWVKKLVRNVRSPGNRQSGKQRKCKGKKCRRARGGRKKGKGGKNSPQNNQKGRKSKKKNARNAGKPGRAKRRRNGRNGKKGKTEGKNNSDGKKKKKKKRNNRPGKKRGGRGKKFRSNNKGKDKKPNKGGKKKTDKEKKRCNGKNCNRNNKRKENETRRTKKNDRSLPEAVYNKLWCIDLAIEQALEKCVEAKIQN